MIQENLSNLSYNKYTTYLLMQLIFVYVVLVFELNGVVSVQNSSTTIASENS